MPNARAIVLATLFLGIAHPSLSAPITLTYQLAPGSSQNVLPGGHPITSGSFTVSLFVGSCASPASVVSGSSVCLHTANITTTAGGGQTAHAFASLLFPAALVAVQSVFGSAPHHSVNLAAPGYGNVISFTAVYGQITIGGILVPWALNSGTTTVFPQITAYGGVTAGAVYVTGGQEVPEPGQLSSLAIGFLLLAPYALLRWRRRYRLSTPELS